MSVKPDAVQWARFHINGLALHAYVGLYEEEKRTGNDFLVDISYSAPYEAAAASDSLSDAVNYGEICRVVEETFQKKCNLLEQICQLTVNAIKEAFPQIRELTVTVTKLNPPVPQTVKGISITVTG